MFCAGRVEDGDLKRTMKACGGSVQTSVQSMTPDVLGTCEVFEESQIGSERFVLHFYRKNNQYHVKSGLPATH